MARSSVVVAMVRSVGGVLRAVLLLCVLSPFPLLPTLSVLLSATSMQLSIRRIYSEVSARMLNATQGAILNVR